MLDLFYVAIGCAFLLALLGLHEGLRQAVGGQHHGLHHCWNRVVGVVHLPDLRAAPSGEVLRREL